MATAPQVVDSELQQQAREHLWMHFSRMGSYGPDHEIPLITKAEGAYVYDDHGNRYLAGLAPGDLNRVFFTNGGSEAVESALKMARNFHRAHGKGQKHKFIAREVAYHGTSLGALSATGITNLRNQFEPLTPGGCHVPNTNIYRWPEDRDPLWAADAIEERIV